MNFKFEIISCKYREEFEKKCTAPNQTNPGIIVSPPGCVMTSTFPNFLETIQNFEVFPDDTWVVTFPKCGTTWTQEMVWLLKNNVDFESAKKTDLRYRVPFLELEAIVSKQEKPQDFHRTIDLTRNLPRPRCIKSHLPLELLPKQIWTVKPKIVYVMRDPRDVCISYYHHYRMWNGYQGSLEEFADTFLHDKVVYTPYWNHILRFLELEDKSHILFNTYEEMKRDLPKVIRKTANFLGVDVTDSQIASMNDHLSFKSMRGNKSVNYAASIEEIKKDTKVDKDLTFIRKGESGQWKDIFTPDILDKFKEWNHHYLKDKEFKEYPWS